MREHDRPVEPFCALITMQTHRFSGIAGAGIPVIALSTLVSLGAAAHGELAGAAVAISGDTIEVEGRQIRLYGVTAPDIDQRCAGARAQWRCGMLARLKLEERIGSSPVICHRQGADGEGRILARCRLDEDQRTELNRWMVMSGWALASGEHGQTFKAAEASARRRGAGLWRDGFEPSEDWRRVAERAERAPGDGAVDCSSCTLRHRTLHPDASEEKPRDAVQSAQ